MNDHNPSEVSSLAVSLHKSLLRNNIKSPDIERLTSSISSYFSTQDINIAEIISGIKEKKFDWHYVENFEHDHISAPSDAQYLTSSFQEAIESIIENMLEYNYEPDEIQSDEKTISFMTYGQPIFKVQKAEFSSADINLAQSIEDSFKGIKRFGEDKNIYSRLVKIPGMDKLHYQEYSDSEPKSHENFSMISMVENFPVFMRRMLNDEFNIEVTQSLSCELFAQTFGLKSWNIFKANSKKYLNTPFYPVILGDSNFKFSIFKKYSEGIAEIINVFNSDPALKEYPELKIIMNDHRYDLLPLQFGIAEEGNDLTLGDEATHVLYSDCIYESTDASTDYFHISNDFNEAAIKISNILGVKVNVLKNIKNAEFRYKDSVLKLDNYLLIINEIDGKVTINNIKNNESLVSNSESFNGIYDHIKFSANPENNKEFFVLDRKDKQVLFRFTSLNNHDLNKLNKFLVDIDI